MLHNSFLHTSKHHHILHSMLTHPQLLSKSTELSSASGSEGNPSALIALTALLLHTLLSHLWSSNSPQTQAVPAHLRPFHTQPHLNAFDNPTLMPEDHNPLYSPPSNPFPSSFYNEFLQSPRGPRLTVTSQVTPSIFLDPLL